MKATPVILRRIMRLALSLIAMAALALKGQAAQVDKQVPFRAAFTTEFDSEFNPPVVEITVIGEGKGTHLGNATTVTTNQIVNLQTGDSTATYTFTAANGTPLYWRCSFSRHSYRPE
jgi:hypothetical protein